MRFRQVPVLVQGGGDLASGVIYRLVRSGFPVLVTELIQPLVIRRTAAYASAVFDGFMRLEGITARQVSDVDEVWRVLDVGEIPVIVDPNLSRSLAGFQPRVLVDGRIAKRNLGLSMDQAPLVIGLGPGFVASEDCHAVVETNRGHYLGRVIWEGSAEKDTGQPGNIAGQTSSRVLRAPTHGHVISDLEIGHHVVQGQTVATVEGVPVTAPFDGVLRGLIHSSLRVSPGMKIGDVDPRGVAEYCWSISEKALAIGGGVLEAILSAEQLACAFEK